MNNCKTIEEILDKFDQTDWPVCLFFIEDGKPVARKLDGYLFDSNLLKEMVELMDEE